jgi:hypothetical protein
VRSESIYIYIYIYPRAESKLEDEGHLDAEEFERIMREQMARFIQASA